MPFILISKETFNQPWIHDIGLPEVQFIGGILSTSLYVVIIFKNLYMQNLIGLLNVLQGFTFFYLTKTLVSSL